MTALQFKVPTLADKQRILTFRREFNAVYDAMHGANELNAFSDGGFVGWINYIHAPAGTQWRARSGLNTKKLPTALTSP